MLLASDIKADHVKFCCYLNSRSHAVNRDLKVAEHTFGSL